METQVNTTFLAMPLLFLFVVGGAVAVAVYLRTRLASTLGSVVASGTNRNYVRRSSFVGELNWLLAPFVVLGSFVLAAGPQPFVATFMELRTRGRHERLAGLESKLPQLSTNVGDVRASVATAAGVGTAGGMNTAVGAPELPAWCRQERSVKGDIVHLVLASRQYSTKSEAENELAAQAIRTLTDDLRQIQFGWGGPLNWTPTAEQVLSHAVRRRHEQVLDHDFGSFKHPMHRVWWEIELSPAVRAEFLGSWRAATASFRIVLVAVTTSVFTLIASVMAMALRIGSQIGYSAQGVSNPTA